MKRSGAARDGCTGVDYSLQHFEGIRPLSTVGIFGIELNIANAVARALYGINGQSHQLGFP